MKKPPVSNTKDKLGVSWTKWFYPSLYISELIRNRMPHMKPTSPAMREAYYKKSQLYAFSYFAIAWTVLGYVVYKSQFSEEERALAANEAGEEDAKSIRTIAKYNNINSFDDENKKIVMYKVKGLGFSSYEKVEVTDDVKKAVMKSNEKDYDKYKDAAYLSRRANIPMDDPRFDIDFWSGYFKKIDNRPTVNESLGMRFAEIKEMLTK